MPGKNKTKPHLSICDACKQISGIRARYMTSRCQDCSRFGNTFECWLIAYLMREMGDNHKIITQLKREHNRMVRYLTTSLLPELEQSTGKPISDSSSFLVPVGRT